MKKLFVLAVMLLVNTVSHAQRIYVTDQPKQTIQCLYSNDNSGSMSKITAITLEQGINLHTFDPSVATLHITVVRDTREYIQEEIFISGYDGVSHGDKYGFVIKHPDGSQQQINLLPEESKDKIYAMIEKITPIATRIDREDD